MIQVRHVTKKFGRATAVDAATLDVAGGESVALWGANGAGKTTLIRCMLGLLRFKGSISIDGFNVRAEGKHARMLMGYVPQELGFHDDLGVAEAVRFFARLKAIDVPSVTPILEAVGLFGQERKRISVLSGGMKQRLALAIAMLGDPPILMLDEVTASLDVCGRDEFVTLLSRMSGSGRTIVFASHRIDEVATLARRVVVLSKGRIDSEMTCDAFVASQASNTVLHLLMPEAARKPAISHLIAAGFSPSLNGVGVLVPVSPEQKAAPFRLLAEAQITIDDFELLVAHPTTHANHASPEARA